MTQNRYDHIYIVEVRNNNGREEAYVGQATTPGRALSHWLGSSNTNLRNALANSVQRTQWPRVRVLKLPEPCLEDLTNAEILLIQTIRDDPRTRASRSNDLSDRALFNLEQLGDDNKCGHRIYLRTTEQGGNESTDHTYTFEKAIADVPRHHTDKGRRHEYWVSKPFHHEKNRDAILAGLNSLFPPKQDAALCHKPPWEDFFQHLNAFEPKWDGQLPYQGPKSVDNLRTQLNAGYILVHLKPEALDERGTIGLELTNKVLRSRVEGYWPKGSPSTAGKGGPTLQDADPQMRPPRFPGVTRPRPEFVLASMGPSKDNAVVIAAWPLANGWKFTQQDQKLVFPLPASTHYRDKTRPWKLARAVIGTHINKSPNVTNRTGVLWVI